LLEAAARADLNSRAQRVSAVIDPVKLIITNYPEGQVENLTAINNPENEADGTHTIAFSRELWIEREDFMEDGGKKFQRLGPGKEVRLKNAYIIKCPETDYCKKDADGNIVEIYAEYDPETRSGMPGADRKIKGKTLHWVSAEHCVEAEVRMYENLWTCENPRDAIKQYEDEHGTRGIESMRPFLNPDSLHIQKGYVEEWAAQQPALTYLQFQRIGYFNVDPDSTPEHPVFNKTVGLKEKK